MKGTVRGERKYKEKKGEVEEERKSDKDRKNEGGIGEKKRSRRKEHNERREKK